MNIHVEQKKYVDVAMGMVYKDSASVMIACN